MNPLYLFLLVPIMIAVKSGIILADKGYFIHPFPLLSGTFLGACFIVWLVVKNRQDALDKPLVPVSLVSDEDAGVTGKKDGEPEKGSGAKAESKAQKKK